MVASAANEAIAPGMPGVPTDKITFASRITIIMEVLTFNAAGVGEKHDHERQHDGNSIHVDRCAQRIAILVILSDTPHLVLHAPLAEGMVAELEQVPLGVQSCRQAGFK